MIYLLNILMPLNYGNNNYHNYLLCWNFGSWLSNLNDLQEELHRMMCQCVLCTIYFFIQVFALLYACECQLKILLQYF